MYVTKLITYFIANAIVLFLANMYAGNFIIFGRAEIGVEQAIATTAFGLAMAALLVDMILRDLSVKIEPDKYLTLELGVNIVALYVLARTPLQNSVGVGLTAFWVAIVLGIALSIAQYLAKTATDKVKVKAR